jgi:hypothetical protein
LRDLESDAVTRNPGPVLFFMVKSGTPQELHCSQEIEMANREDLGDSRARSWTPEAGDPVRPVGQGYDPALSAKDQAHDLAQQAKEVAGQAKEQVKDLASQAKDQTVELAYQAKDQVTDLVAEQKARAAERLGGLAGALHEAAQRLEQRDADGFGRYAHRAADQMDRVSRYLRDKDLPMLVRDTETFARRHPDIFLGGSLFAGVLLARFLKSSAERRSPWPDELSTRPVAERYRSSGYAGDAGGGGAPYRGDLAADPAVTGGF